MIVDFICSTGVDGVQESLKSRVGVRYVRSVLHRVLFYQIVILLPVFHRTLRPVLNLVLWYLMLSVLPFLDRMRDKQTVQLEEPYACGTVATTKMWKLGLVGVDLLDDGVRECWPGVSLFCLFLENRQPLKGLSTAMWVGRRLPWNHWITLAALKCIWWAGSRQECQKPGIQPATCSSTTLG